MSSVPEIVEAAHCRPMPELAAALQKKLSTVDIDRLALWVDAERDFAAQAEWDRQSPRVKAAEALLAACEAAIEQHRAHYAGLDDEANCRPAMLPIYQAMKAAVQAMKAAVARAKEVS